MRRRVIRAIGGVALVAVVVLAGLGVYAFSYAASVPGTANPIRLGLAPAADDAAVPDGRIGGPVGSSKKTCFDRLDRAAGSLELCAEVSRLGSDGDTVQDYYMLEVTGKVHGNDFPSGVRWARMIVKPSFASPISGGLDQWPGQRYDGGCGRIQWTTIMGEVWSDFDACGRMTESSDDGRTYQIDWVSTGNPLPVSGDRAIAFAEVAGVSEGQLPTWEILADFGN